MLDVLKIILDMQELDMKMIRLMRVKKQRQKELDQIDALRRELHEQLKEKETEIKDVSANISRLEEKIEEIKAKIKRLENQQNNVKKVDEFNALTKEMSATEKERITTEHQVSDLVDKRNSEEEILEKIRTSLANSEESSIALQKEIQASIHLINDEGQDLKQSRDKLAMHADPELLRIYERLLRNKKDRVVVPIVNRTCSGCHIALTAQHENLVRRGDNLVFCEHCSRILFWQESEALEGTAVAVKRRRRRSISA